MSANPFVYFLAASAVSPQVSFQQMLSNPTIYNGDKLNCIEPDYTKYIDSKLLRRMSRIIKMGVAAASEALAQTAIKKPDAIITGTAYGCLTDTDQFLTRMVEFKETLLSPTAFIQSTHNTVAAQIALLLQCNSYNNTFVHRGSSFEAALTDAISLIEDGDAATVLLGAADEITEKSHTILKRFGLYKKDGNSANLINSNTKGTMAGEGAAFFVMGKNKEGSIARLDAFKNYYKPQESASDLIKSFLRENNIVADEIDLIIDGKNGNEKEQKHYNQLNESIFKTCNVASFKQYCGEYPSSVSFALWMAVEILKQKIFNDKPAQKILIYNNYIQSYPSLFLLSAC